MSRRTLSRKDALDTLSAWIYDTDVCSRSLMILEGGFTGAQTAAPVTPAMLAQIAGQARNLLSR